MADCPHVIQLSRPLALNQESTFSISPVPSLPCEWTFAIAGIETRTLTLDQTIRGFRIKGVSAAHVTVEPVDPAANAPLRLWIQCPDCDGVVRTLDAALAPAGQEEPGLLDAIASAFWTALGWLWEGLKSVLLPGTLLIVMLCALFGNTNHPLCLRWLLPEWFKELMRRLFNVRF